jgi:hypothetical protein
VRGNVGAACAGIVAAYHDRQLAFSDCAPVIRRSIRWACSSSQDRTRGTFTCLSNPGTLPSVKGINTCECGS